MRWLLLLGAAAIPAFASTLKAQNASEAIGLCNNENGIHSAESQIKGCTSIVNAPRVSSGGLAIAFNNRGLAYERMGKHRRAILDYDQAVALSPSDPRFLNNRCYARTIIDDLSRALEDCDAALRLRPNDPTILDSRGFTYLKLGLLGRAVADFDAALRADLKLASSRYLRGVARLRMGDNAGAKADIDAALTLKPEIAAEFRQYGINPRRTND